MKVLIVEDERFIAQSVAQLVGEHPACTVAGTVGNGAEALKLMEQNPADLVITDIRMPVMDGMELLRQLQQRWPQCFTVVLSGYSDFNYARTALQCQAFDYLLKPVVRSKLFPILDKVAAAWQTRRRTQQRIRIQQALDGMILRQEGAESYYVLLSPPSQEPPEAVFGDGCQLFRSAFEQILVVEDGTDVSGKAPAYLERLQSDVPVNLICTRKAVPVWSLQTVTAQLRRMLRERVRMFRSELFVVDPSEPQVVQPGVSLRDLRPSRAVDAICTKKPEELRVCLLEVLSMPDLRRMEMQNYLDAVLGDSRLAYHLSPERLSRTKTVLADRIAKAAAPEDCVRELVQQLLEPQDETAAKRDAAVIVQEIARQLDTDFHLPFTTEGLAKQHGLTPRYLNKVFKEYKGVRPMEYLVSLRMKRAKFILETMPDAMIKDVANSVGYSDPLYFSKTFKKETGLWPKQCQDAGRKE